jgi:signal transduction histidine kinase
MQGDKDGSIRLPIESAGLWAEVVRERKPVIVNDYPASNLRDKECHECPIELSRLMSVPVFDGDWIVAIALLANKKEEYDASDARQSALLMDGVLKLIQRERAEKALLEAESLAAMGRALSGLAHDIKTPLIAIGGFARQVQKHTEREGPDWKKLDIVLKETGRLEKMVKDMLDFSRPLQLDRSMEDINRVTEESLALLENPVRERRVKLESRLAPDPPMIYCDAMRMKQVIMNLVLNAIQATAEGQTIRVRTHQRPGRVLIDVTDSGSGIPPEKREDIFLPFVSTKKEGTGLGLPIVKKIVEAHQGHIEILDNLEKGLTFRVVIPATL